MAIHKILSSLVALNLIGYGLSVPTYTDVKTEPLVPDESNDPLLLHKRIQEVIIGYRRDQAKMYEEAGNTLTPGHGLGGDQLGQGVYTSDEAGSWEGEEDTSSKNCAILASSEAFDKVPKAWIPRPSWWPTPFKARVDDYIKTLALNPAKTIRMSVVDIAGKETLQMLIPNGLLNSNGGGLDIVVNCEDEDKKLELPKHKVDYNAWANVVGEKYAPAEKKIQKLNEPAEKLAEDSDAALAEAKKAASVNDAKAASAKAKAALKSLQVIAQQTVEYTIQNNDWLFIKNNLDTFSRYNKARVNFQSAILRVEEKRVEEYKTKFDKAVKLEDLINEVDSEAQSLAAQIATVLDKVQKDLDAKKALKSNPSNSPPLQLRKLDSRDVFELSRMEAEVIASEIAVLSKSFDKLAETQRQVQAQLEKLETLSPEAKEQEKAKVEKATEERKKVATDLEKSGDTSWWAKALGGLGAVAGTLVGGGGLYLASTSLGAGAGPGASTGAGASSFVVGEVTISTSLVSLEVTPAEVDAVIQELVPEITDKAVRSAAQTLRPPAGSALGKVKMPVLARRRRSQAAQAGNEVELTRWRVAALALVVRQAIKDALEEAFQQALKETKGGK
ncbi:hypothetical protein MY11210_009624 [Beauveria gryllotalpidicola]